MTNKSLISGLIVLVLGLALIVGGFYLFVGVGGDERIFWLSLTSVCIAYGVNISYLFDFFGTRSKFENQIGGLGIRMWFVPIYSVAVVASVFLLARYQIEFKYQLYAQSILVFFLILMMITVQVVTTHIASVSSEQDSLRSIKTEISATLHGFELWCVQVPQESGVISSVIESLQQEIRFVSPSDNTDARNIEMEVLSNLKKAFELCKQHQVSEAIHVLDECRNLIKVRKNLYSN